MDIDQHLDMDRHLAAFSAQNPQAIAQTPRATIWRVDTNAGPAVLKILTQEGLKARELEGAQALRLWDGVGAVRLLGLNDNALLMDWLPGPTLGDLARKGQDIAAAHHLADVAQALRRSAQPDFDDLRIYGAALTRAGCANMPAVYANAFARAQALWQHLLDSTQQTRFLHADLHHDNILQGPNGWCAIDPKGVNGDPCYEFANALKNPVGMETQVADPVRISALAQLFAQTAHLDPSRIIAFGFAHAALSLSWHMERGVLPEAGLIVLAAFDKLCDAPLP